MECARNEQQKTILPFLPAKSILSLKKLFGGSLQYRQTKLLKGIIGEVLHLVIDLWLQFRLDLLCGETLLLMMPSIYLAQNLLNLGERRRSGEEVVEKDEARIWICWKRIWKLIVSVRLASHRGFSLRCCLLAAASSPPFWDERSWEKGEKYSVTGKFR